MDSDEEVSINHMCISILIFWRSNCWTPNIIIILSRQGYLYSIFNYMALIKAYIAYVYLVCCANILRD